jgi:hypothetical protein
MLKFVAFALFLTGTPALAMDEGQMDAIIASCQAGQVCSCPRAKPLMDQINRDNEAAVARESARQAAIQEEARRQAKESPPLRPQVAEREQVAPQASAPPQFVGASLGLLKDCYIDKILGGGNMPVCLLDGGYVMQGDMCQAHDVVNGRPAIICAGQYGTPAYLRRKQDWYAGPFQ